MPSSAEKRRIAYALAISQHGVVARRQLLERGLSSSLIRYWTTSGRLVRVFAGTYALGRPAVRREALWMAAALAGGPTAVIAGEAAAAAWGFADPPSVVDVIRPEGPRRSVRASPPHDGLVMSLRRARLGPHEACRLGPLPVASVDRVLTDLAGTLPAAKLRRRFIEAGRIGRLTPDCLARLEACQRRYKGRARLMKLVAAWGPRPGRIRSILEGEFRLLCTEQGLPLPRTNQRLGRFEVDCVWPEARLVVELDGRRFHSDPFALEADSEKARALRSLGYTVLRFTWEEVTGSPEVVAELIRQALDDASLAARTPQR